MSTSIRASGSGSHCGPVVVECVEIEGACGHGGIDQLNLGIERADDPERETDLGACFAGLELHDVANADVGSCSELGLSDPEPTTASPQPRTQFGAGEY